MEYYIHIYIYIYKYKEPQLPANLMHQDPFLQCHELRLTANELPHFLAFYDLQGECRRTILPRFPTGRQLIPVNTFRIQGVVQIELCKAILAILLLHSTYV